MECISRMRRDFLYFHECKNVLPYQPWNIAFYPLDKNDIFTGCYFHTVKITVWKWQAIVTSCRVLHAVTCSIDVHACSKAKENVKKLKIQTLNREFISHMRQDFFFSYFHSCFALVKISKLLSQLWKKFHIQRQNIEYPL